MSDSERTSTGPEAGQGNGAGNGATVVALRPHGNPDGPKPPRRRVRIRKLRLLLLLGRPRHPGRGLDRVRDDDGRRLRPAEARAQERPQLGHPRQGQPPARLPDGQPEARLPHRGRGRAGDEARDHRDRGPPLLHQRGRRPARHRPRLLPGRRPEEGGPGRLDDHAAARQERARRPGRPHAVPEAARGRARVPPHARVVEGEDPQQLPEHDLLRERRLRPRGGRADVLPAQPSGLRRARRQALRLRPAAGRGGAAGRDGRRRPPRTTRSRIPRRRRAAATSCSSACSSSGS